MKALSWLLPGVALLCWAAFCHFYRHFPLLLTIVMAIVAVLMMLGAGAVHLFEKWKI
ncbi:hypothetical protein [Sphingomonas sp. T9W2]|jgi:hypothetical protein|uniref:hypothetical protein n=1 Tax=Sphingomonas sp. T9W2 TaxID=3143183 RepID=UPI0031F525E3